MFTSAEIEAVRDSFAAAIADEPELIARFYDRLFFERPELRAMFPRTFEAQAAKLQHTLDLALAGLRHPQALEAPLRAHGRRHAGLGVTPSHYQVVEQVLVAVLAETAGPAWTPEAAQGWDRLLGYVCATMIAGAREGRARPAHPGAAQPLRPAGTG
ncbi:globin domain-containing protein [Frigidibacter sp. MR17.14]|uniref:globin domain-containing protein n=1 Tax=Frigidibacter sp. MR17.14 TaxID=3126509 RepID=UPI00301319AF